MKLQDVCEKTNISKRNIYFYINEDLLTPMINPVNHYYDFSEEDCRKLIFIREMRNAGLSISTIRSLIKNPLMAGYYLNKYVKKLKKEQRYIEQTLVSLQYILEELPFYPDFHMLCKLASESGIPVMNNEDDFENKLDSYNTTVINRFLWGGFMQETKLSEYQQFLWMKLNRLTMEEPSEAYICIGKFLNSLPSAQADRLFSRQSTRYAYIVSLDEKGCEICAADMISRLRECLMDAKYIRFWNQYYDSYFYPFVTIQASELSALVMEMSPFYRQYVTNIIKVCDLVYQFLCSDNGNRLYQDMKNAFGDNFDLESSNHGILEAMVSLPEMYSNMTDSL